MLIIQILEVEVGLQGSGSSQGVGLSRASLGSRLVFGALSTIQNKQVKEKPKVGLRNL